MRGGILDGFVAGGEGSSRLTVNKDREGSGGNAGTDETNEVRLETKTVRAVIMKSQSRRSKALAKSSFRRNACWFQVLRLKE